MTRAETKEDVLRILRDHEEELRALGIERLDLFGSFARNEAGPGSDVDLYVRFAAKARVPASRYFAYRDRLADLLHRDVDLVSAGFDNPYFHRLFKQDAVRVI